MTLQENILLSLGKDTEKKLIILSIITNHLEIEIQVQDQGGFKFKSICIFFIEITEKDWLKNCETDQFMKKGD